MKSLLTLVVMIGLAGCVSSPLPHSYVLSAPAAPVAGVYNEAGRPVLELPTVALPDYLDSTDILLRDGRNELKPSATGRWGERLSVGITQALAADLTRRLPGLLVTHTPVPGQASPRLLVDVDAFDIRPDGQCVLTARWTVPGTDGQAAVIAERGTFLTQATGPAGSLADAAIVSAMATAVDQLADRIAVSLRRSPIRTR